MQQLLQNLRHGHTAVADVPAPGPRQGALLVRTTRSLISAGTERMLVDFGKAGWIGKARQQPEKVRAVLNRIRSDGLVATLRAVQSKLDQPIPLGYCQVGVVVDTGAVEVASPLATFAAGDRVVSNGPHAEVVTVSHNLCARIPAGVSDDAAAFTPLAAIALEGIHLLEVGPGDKVVVTGLGLIGQLAVRILRAKGCEVLGFDPAANRRELASKSGACPSDGDPVTAALAWSTGAGVAGVLITASTASNEVVNQAARSCRFRGRVVLVGVVGLQLNRADFYRNEVSFQVSCSYGKRDGLSPQSARRNFEQVLAWMAEGKLLVEDLITHRFEFTQAAQAYGALADRGSLGILLRYENTGDEVLARTIRRNEVDGSLGTEPTHRIALVGAGNFALRTLLPALKALRPPPHVATVVSRQGAAAMLGARAAGARQATTDYATVLADPTLSAVVVTTSHDAHADQAIAALRAGKHVWVEKPLVLREADLARVESAVRDSGKVLFVGFNRRFAPMTVALRAALAAQGGPMRLVMTVNAGRLDPDHWTLDPSAGGGRIVGEACHFVDLMRFLAGSKIAGVRCIRRDTDGQDGGAFEVELANGSSGLIDYRTDLPSHLPKERIVVSGAEFTAEILNWAQLRSHGLGVNMGGWGRRTPRKGHREALAAFLAAAKSGVAPIPLEEVVEVSRWSIAMQAMPSSA